MAGDFDFDADPPPRRTVYVSRQAARSYPATNSLGITSLVLGVASLPLMCVPGLNLFAVVLGGVGFLLGVAGLVASLARQGYGIGYAIGGMAACSLAVVVALVVGAAFVQVVRDIDTARQPDPPAKVPAKRNGPRRP